MNDIYNPHEDEPSHLSTNANHDRTRNKKEKLQCNGNSQKPKKLLECHAFVCNSQADAIAIAAQLYQALVETIRKFNRHAENRNGKQIKETIKGNNSCRVSIFLDVKRSDMYLDHNTNYSIVTNFIFFNLSYG